MKSLTLLNELIINQQQKGLLIKVVDHRYFITTNHNSSFEIYSSSNLITSFPSDNHINLLCFHHLPESNSLFIGLSNGILLSIDLITNSTHQIVDSFIDDNALLLCCSWSPDNETLVLVTDSLHFIILNSNFDLVCDPSSLLETRNNHHVSVGWGKVETQFNGKQTNTTTTTTTTSSTNPLPNNPHSFLTQLSWHGNGSLFAIQFFNPLSNRIQFYTFDSYGTFISSSLSNPVSDSFVLLHPLAWKPLGNLIASAQTNTSSNTTQIIFYEPNGLRHGEFNLPNWINNLSLDKYQIKNLYWNSDSTILLVWISFFDDHSSSLCDDRLLLYTCKNAHWYLKQSVCCPIAHTRFVHISWDLVDPLVLHVVTATGMYWKMNWTWDVLRQCESSSQHYASVGVVDDHHVLHTPMAVTNIPPPFSKSKLAINASIKSMAFCIHPLFLEWIAILHGDSVSIFDGSILNPVMQSSFRIPNVSHLNLRQLIYPNHQTLVALGYDFINNVDVMVHVELDPSVSSTITVSTTVLPFIAGRISGFPDNSSIPTTTTVILQDCDGGLWRGVWDQCNDEYHLDYESKFPRFSDQMAVILAPSETTPMLSPFAIVGLTLRSKLILSNKALDEPVTLSSECSSFLVHSTYLIYTTLSHQVVFLPISQLFMPPSSPKTADSGLVRAIERGAVLTTVHPYGSGLVLQMPRGNLETIYPRPLVVNQIVNHIKKGEWGLAITSIRKYRVEFNLLVDYNLNLFLEAAPSWMNQVRHPDHVNLILSNLKDNEDVIVSLYPWIEYPNRQRLVGSEQSKVTLVCQAVRQSILSNPSDCDTWLNTLVTTYIKSSPSDVPSALRLIKQYVTLGQTKLAEQALKYTIFLVKVDFLYQEALGMYDFELTNMVAQFSNKDPREYLPFLQGLRALTPDAYQNYRIDMYLNRPRSALMHLLNADVHQGTECAQVPGLDTFSEIMELLAQHTEFYPISVAYYHQANQPIQGESMQVKINKIAKAYGQHLESQGQYKQAGCMYEYGGIWDLAQSVWAKAEGEWRRVLSVASHRSINENGNDGSIDVVRVAIQLADTLIQRTEYEAAACVLCEYVGNIESGITQYMRVYDISEACRRAYLYNRPDLIDTLICPLLLTGCQELIALVNECRLDVQQRVDRLIEIRTSKQRYMEQQVFDGSQTEQDQALVYDSSMLNHLETLLETSSMISTFTGMTLNTVQSTIGHSFSSGHSSRRTSSKQKRKQERKRHSGKKGSVYEHSYLVESLTQVIGGRVRQLGLDVGKTLPFLVQYQYVNEATGLQTTYQLLVKYVETSVLPVLQQQITEHNQLDPKQVLVQQYRRVAESGGSLQQAALHPDSSTMCLDQHSRLGTRSQLLDGLALPSSSDWMLDFLDLAVLPNCP